MGGLEEFVAVAFFPLAAFAFGEAALVAFFAELAVGFFGEAAFFGFGEDLGGGVVEVGGAGDGGGGPFFEKFDDFDGALEGVVVAGNDEGVAGF